MAELTTELTELKTENLVLKQTVAVLESEIVRMKDLYE
jgi:hypothetical protein